MFSAVFCSLQAQEQACQEVEEEWQQRLAQALEETKRATVELKDHGSQTDETLRQVIARAVEEQTLSLREALKAKEKSLREQEANYHESIATQVTGGFIFMGVQNKTQACAINVIWSK